MAIISLTEALAPGMSETTVDAQLTKALVYWNAIAASPMQLASFGSAAANYGASAADATNAIAWLTAYQSYIHSPSTIPQSQGVGGPPG